MRHIINKLNVIIWSEVDSQTDVSCGNNIFVSFVHLSYLLANKKVIIILDCWESAAFTEVSSDFHL